MGSAFSEESYPRLPAEATSKWLRVCKHPDRGRYIVAATEIPAGTDILTASAYVYAASPDCSTALCDVCWGSIAHSTLCPSCSSALYCSESCLKKDRSLHVNFCDLLVAFTQLHGEEDYVKRTFTMILKLLSLKSRFSERFKDVEGLQAEFSPSAEAANLRVIRLLNECGALKRFLGDHPDSDREILLRRLIAAVDCNQFAVLTLTNELAGTALVPGASLFNHSCLPTCHRLQDFGSITIRTLVPVEEGEELSICYLNANDDKAARDEQLADQYGFSCSCVRCVDSTAATAELFWETFLRCPNGIGFLGIARTESSGADPGVVSASVGESQERRECTFQCGFGRTSLPVPKISSRVKPSK